MWVREYRMDGLRLDAVHAIYDMGARHLLAELADRARDASPRPALLIAESDLNDPRILRPGEVGGYGIDAQWYDDFHHSLHALLTGERDGYYRDFGSVEDLATATRRALRVRRPLLGVPAAAARRPGRRPPAGPVRRLLPEPRPGGQPRGRATGRRRRCAPWPPPGSSSRPTSR